METLALYNSKENENNESIYKYVDKYSENSKEINSSMTPVQIGDIISDKLISIVSENIQKVIELKKQTD